MTSSTCPCHGVPWMTDKNQRRCRIKVRAIQRRYNQKPQSRARRRRLNRKRIYVGNNYRGRVASVEHADQINAHIRRRIGEFSQRQSH